MLVPLRCLLLLKCLGLVIGFCVLDKKKGWWLDCGIRDSYLLRLKDYGGVQANFNLGFGIGDEKGFPNSISKGTKKGKHHYHHASSHGYDKANSHGYSQDSTPGYSHGSNPGYSHGPTPEYSQSSSPGYSQGSASYLRGYRRSNVDQSFNQRTNFPYKFETPPQTQRRSGQKEKPWSKIFHRFSRKKSRNNNKLLSRQWEGIVEPLPPPQSHERSEDALQWASKEDSGLKTPPLSHEPPSGSTKYHHPISRGSVGGQPTAIEVSGNKWPQPLNQVVENQLFKQANDESKQYQPVYRGSVSRPIGGGSITSQASKERDTRTQWTRNYRYQNNNTPHVVPQLPPMRSSTVQDPLQQRNFFRSDYAPPRSLIPPPPPPPLPPPTSSSSIWNGVRRQEFITDNEFTFRIPSVTTRRTPTISPALADLLNVPLDTVANTDNVPSFAAVKFVVREAPLEFYPYDYRRRFDSKRRKIHVEIPRTKFYCEEQKFLPGIYADAKLGCKMFHLCVPSSIGSTLTSYFCPNGTLFDQSILQCNHWYNVDCEASIKDYDANLALALSYRKINAAHISLPDSASANSLSLLSQNVDHFQGPSSATVSRRMGKVLTDAEDEFLQNELFTEPSNSSVVTLSKNSSVWNALNSSEDENSSQTPVNAHSESAHAILARKNDYESEVTISAVELMNLIIDVQNKLKLKKKLLALERASKIANNTLVMDRLL